jgi:hypothetical protein
MRGRMQKPVGVVAKCASVFYSMAAAYNGDAYF